MKDIKLDEIIRVKKIEKTGQESWKGSDHIGFVAELDKDEEEITIIKPNGEAYRESFDDPEFDYKIIPASEHEYRRKIKEEIRYQEEIVENRKEDLERMKEWRDQFENEISLIGKIKKLIKRNT